MEDNLLKRVWKHSSERLKKVGVKTPLLDSRLLIQLVLNINYETLLTSAKRVVTEEELAALEVLMLRRLKREPVAKILGKKGFWKWEFKTTTDTLDPRPESEFILDAILNDFKDKSRKLKILDLGTGTGCLAISVLKEFKNAEGVAVDISDNALAVAKENAETLEVANRLNFVKSSWFENIDKKYLKKFDIIISNPPYIKTEIIDLLDEEVRLFDPLLALDGGKKGMDAYNIIAPQLEEYLTPHGRCYFEIGKWQEEPFRQLVQYCGFVVEKVYDDLTGVPRVVAFHQPFLKAVS